MENENRFTDYYHQNYQNNSRESEISNFNSQREIIPRAALIVNLSPEPSSSIARSSDLPSYDEAITDSGGVAPPPSYDSLFGRVIEAQRQSKNRVDFMKKVFVLILGTLGCTIILGITIVIPICMIIIGLLFLKKCPVQDFIPVYLVVGGFMGVMKQLLNLSRRVRKDPQDQVIEQMRQLPTQFILNAFIFGWFLIGSYFVYINYEPNYNPNEGKYCNYTLYMFTFWLITWTYIGLAIVIITLFLVSILSVMYR